MNKVRITMEFDTIEDAIVALGNALPKGPDPVDVKSEAKKASKVIAERKIDAGAQNLMDKYGLKADQITATAKNGKIFRKDVEKYVNENNLGKNPPVPPVVESDALRDSLKSLNDRRGYTVCQQFLRKFGAEKITDLRPEQHEEFIKKAGEL